MPNDIARRKFVKGLPLMAAGLAFAGKNAAAQQHAAGSANTLVAYYSRTGNTTVIARQIRRARQAVLFEIKTASPYPEDYDETVAQASRETKSSYLPPLGQFVADSSQYDTIYLGFPIWGMTAPPVICSFLRAHDLSGKTIVPFMTHGGYGLGDTLEVLRALSRGARVMAAFSMEADQEKRTVEQVSGWLAG